jgi:hypothetical protein
MALIIKNLYEGQLPDSKDTLYTVPADTSAIVVNITLVNTDSSARTVNLYYKKSGSTSRRIITKDLSLTAGVSHERKGRLTMGTGDEIEGDASVAAVVDVVISGLERL